MNETLKKTTSSYHDIGNGHTSCLSVFKSITKQSSKYVRTKLLNALAYSKEYCEESDRIKSFTDRWPCLQSPERFGKCGFYFEGEDDLVRCYQCGIRLYKWLEDDNPLEEHIKYSPRCSFIQNEILSRPEPLANLIMQVIRRKFSGTARSDQALEKDLDEAVVSELEVNRRLKKRLTCRICRQDGAWRAYMFLPCRHLLSCEQCAKEIIKCPVPTCGNLIIETTKAELYPPFK